MKLLEKIICLKNALFLNFCFSVRFEPMLGWECAYVSHDLSTKKESIYRKLREYKTNRKLREYKTNNCHKSDLDLEREASKVGF